MENENQQIDPHRITAIELLKQAYLTDGISSREISQVYHDNALLVERRLFNYFRSRSQEEGWDRDREKEEYSRQLIRISLHLSQRTLPGYYALDFNQKMRRSLAGINSLSIPQIEFEEHPQEEEALLRAFNESIILPQVKFFRSDGETDLPDHLADDLYSQHFNRLTLESDPKAKSKSTPDQFCIFTDLNWEDLPDGVPRTPPYRETFCVETRELLQALLGDKINPVTGLKMTPETVQELKSRYLSS